MSKLFADELEDTVDSILEAVGMEDGGFCSRERITIIQNALLRVLAYTIAHQPQRHTLLDIRIKPGGKIIGPVFR